MNIKQGIGNMGSLALFSGLLMVLVPLCPCGYGLRIRSSACSTPIYPIGVVRVDSKLWRQAEVLREGNLNKKPMPMHLTKKY